MSETITHGNCALCTPADEVGCVTHDEAGLVACEGCRREAREKHNHKCDALSKALGSALALITEAGIDASNAERAVFDVLAARARAARR